MSPFWLLYRSLDPDSLPSSLLFAWLACHRAQILSGTGRRDSRLAACRVLESKLVVVYWPLSALSAPACSSLSSGCSLRSVQGSREGPECHSVTQTNGSGLLDLFFTCTKGITNSSVWIHLYSDYDYHNMQLGWWSCCLCGLHSHTVYFLRWNCSKWFLKILELKRFLINSLKLLAVIQYSSHVIISLCSCITRSSP